MITLLSTVVAPEFAAGLLSVSPVDPETLKELLPHIDRNLCGHPATIRVLKDLCPSLPESERAFWDGSTTGLAVRPRGGVRNAAQAGNTQVTLDDLEAALVYWMPTTPTLPETPAHLRAQRIRQRLCFYTPAITPAYLRGNEWGEAEFCWCRCENRWLEKPPLYTSDNQQPGDDLDLLRVEGGVEVYRVKYPHER